MINSYQVRFQISFLIILVFIIVPNYATSKSIVELYNEGEYKKVIDKVGIEQSELSDDQNNYLLLKVYEKLSDLQSQKNQLLKIESSYPDDFKNVVLVEKLNLAIGSKSPKEFFDVVPDILKESESLVITERIRQHLIAKASQIKDKQMLRPALEAYVSHIQPDENNTALVALYNEAFNAPNPKDSLAKVNLWAQINKKDIPKSLQSISGITLKDADIYLTQIRKHFDTQRKVKNYTYSIERIPKYLAAIKNRESEDFKRLKFLYFFSMKRKRQYTTLIDQLDDKKTIQRLGIIEKEAKIQQFDLRVRKGQLEKARKLIELMKKANPELDPNPYILSIANYLYGKRKLKEAITEYKKIDTNRLDNEQLSRVNWQLWRSYQLSKRQKEMKKLADWAQKFQFQNREIGARFCYWSVKLKLSDNGTYTNCFERFPLTYYGLHAKQSASNNQKLGVIGSFEGDPPSFLKSNIKLSEPSARLFSFIKFLYQINENKLADELAKMKILKWEKDLLYLADILLEEKRYYLVQLIVESKYRSYLETSIGARRALLPYFYPKAYLKTVNQHNKDRKKKAPDLLVLSVMREESHFNPEVESVAGAIGLMQLMPKTAKYLGKLSKRKVKLEELKNPELNLKLGGFYLGRLLKRYNGNMFHTLAAYNGGPTNVKRWIVKSKSKDHDEFVETITFEETKNYVRRVMRSFYIYQELYGKAI